MKRIEFIIKADGTVTEQPLEGFTGNECHEATQGVEQALGMVKDSEPTDGAYRAPVVRQGARQGR